MAQDPFKVDQLQIEPGSGDTILIRRHSDGSLKFTDALVSDIVLSQLANLSTIEGVRIVGRAGYAQYTSVQDALDSIPTGSSSTNPHLVLVMPGVYTEDLSLIRDGVTIQGLGHVVLRSLLEDSPDASGATHTLSIAASGTTPLLVDLVNLTITNSHSAKACVYASGASILTEGLNIRDCVLSPSSDFGNFSVLATCVNRVTVTNSRVGGGASDQIRLYEVAEFESLRSVLGAVQCRWDNDQTTPNNVPTTHTYQQCDISTGSGLDNSFVLGDGSGAYFHSCRFGSSLVLDGTSSDITFEFCTVTGSVGISALATCAIVSKHTVYNSALPSNSTATFAVDSISGFITFEGTSSESVVFDTPQPDEEYHIVLTVEGDSSGECPYLSAKSSSGFSVTFNTSQTLTTRWRLFR